jgi:hypothetical protein
MSDNVQGDKVGNDKIGADKVLGDKVAGDKHVTFAAPDNSPLQSRRHEADLLEAALRELAELPTDTVPDPQSLPPNSHLTYSQNPRFTGRTAELQRLAQTLKGERGTAVINTPAAVMGMGGVGKTQLAAEFAHRYGRYFQGGVYWLSFADPEAVPAEIAACGRKMALPGLDSLPLAQQVERVLTVWENPLPRLLIFDNCEEEALLERYRPKSGGARILLTSRRSRWSPGFGLSALPLDTLLPAESVRLLRQFWPSLAETEVLRSIPDQTWPSGSALALFFLTV